MLFSGSSSLARRVLVTGRTRRVGGTAIVRQRSFLASTRLTLAGHDRRSQPFFARREDRGQIRWHGGGGAPPPGAKQVSLTFIDPKLPGGEQVREVNAHVGQTLLQVAHNNEIDLEGACEGVCACSTCHVILPDDIYDNLEEATEDEEDMLDMAFGLTDTSRLGCQVEVSEEMDGIEIKLPAATRNFYVDGHVPKPH